MKYAAILFILLIAFSCAERPKETNTPVKRVSRFEKLLSKYKFINADTLEIHYVSGSEEKSKFYGVVLDSLEQRLFPYDLKDYTDYYQFFACFKFTVDSNRIGLITRSPSMYESTSIKVLVYDLRLDSITYYFEAAEDWGDAGAALKKTSWLYKNKDGYKIFTVCDDIYDHRSDSEGKDTAVEYNTSSYILSIDKYHPDTISRNDIKLLKHFRPKL